MTLAHDHKSSLKNSTTGKPSPENNDEDNNTNNKEKNDDNDTAKSPQAYL